MDYLDHQVQLLLHSFRFELSYFLQGMMSLMENRLSPLIVSPEALVSAFDHLASNARKRNLIPSSEDPGILFQVPVSTLSNSEGNLYAVVHLPLYLGNTSKLYRHVPASFFLGNTSVILDVESPAEFLAWDTHRMVRSTTVQTWTYFLRIWQRLVCMIYSRKVPPILSGRVMWGSKGCIHTPYRFLLPCNELWPLSLLNLSSNVHWGPTSPR